MSLLPSGTPNSSSVEIATPKTVDGPREPTPTSAYAANLRASAQLNKCVVCGIVLQGALVAGLLGLVVALYVKVEQMQVTLATIPSLQPTQLWARPVVTCPNCEPGSEYEFGEYISLSHTGRFMAVGAPNEQSNTTFGIVAVYEYTGEAYKLRAPVLSGAEHKAALGGANGFGAVVRLSADGDLLAVGAYNAEVDEESWANEQGAVAVFAFDAAAGAYVPRCPPLISNHKQDRFGNKMAMSSGGEILAVSAENRLEVLVYEWEALSSTYLLHGNISNRKFDGDEEEDGGFGSAVEVSGDGSTLLIANEDAKDKAGVVYAFVRNGSAFERKSTLWGRRIPGAEFGEGMSISYDGGTVVVGAEDEADDAGRGYVYERHDSGAFQWSQMIAPSVVLGETNFGEAVAMSGNGARVAMGGPRHGDRKGMAYLYDNPRDGSGLSLATKLSPPAGSAGGRFGKFIALSGDGKVMAVSEFQGNGVVHTYDIFG